MVLKELNFYSFYMWEGVTVLKVTDLFRSFYFRLECGGFVRSDFEQLILWEGVVVLKEPDL